jgi:O-methyltransferase
MFKELVKSAIHRLGFELVRTKKNQGPCGRGAKSEAEEMIEIVRSRTMVSNEGLSSLYRQALFCEEHELAGDFVECGVWKGGAVGLMALVNLKHGSLRRHLHLFDSFEEICEPDEEIDGHRAASEVRKWTKNGGVQGRLVPLKGIYDHRGGPGTVQENEHLLGHVIGYDPEYIHLHKGWFQHTLPQRGGETGKIAILRIDADWYASTKICLEHLFGKVVPGGFVIIDDYGAYEGCRKAVDEFLASTGKPLFLNYVNPDIRYIIVPQ